MKDIGKSHKHSMVTEANEDSKIYPSVSISHKSMPHLKKHKVGDTGHMHIKYKVKGQQEYRNGEGETHLEITHAEHNPNESKKHEAAESKGYEAAEEKGAK